MKWASDLDGKTWKTWKTRKTLVIQETPHSHVGSASHFLCLRGAGAPWQQKSLLLSADTVEEVIRYPESLSRRWNSKCNPEVQSHDQFHTWALGRVACLVIWRGVVQHLRRALGRVKQRPGMFIALVKCRDFFKSIINSFSGYVTRLPKRKEVGHWWCRVYKVQDVSWHSLEVEVCIELYLVCQGLLVGFLRWYLH